MKKILVDTNLFLRFFINDIPEQKKVCEKLLLAANKKEILLIVAQQVIFEMDYVLEKTYKVEKDTAISYLYELISSDAIQIESRSILLSALHAYKATTKVSLVDCFLLYKAQEENAQL